MISEKIEYALHSLERSSVQKRPLETASCIVRKVSAMSPVGAAGIAPGDWLIEINGASPIGYDVRKFLSKTEPISWTFYRPGSTIATTIKSIGYPIGMEFGPLPGALTKLTSTGRATLEDCEFVWQVGDWKHLKEACLADLKCDGLKKWWREWRGQRSRHNCVAWLLLGAAEFELGEVDAGLDKIYEFHEQYETNWTCTFQAIARYYLGREAELRGNHVTAATLYRQAYRMWPIDKFELAFRMTGLYGNIEERRERLSEFPSQYQLRDISSGEYVSLLDATRELGLGELHTICLLGPYRANGPYYHFMRTYRQWKTFFPGHFRSLHVITQCAQPSEDKVKWLASEESALRAGLPFSVLLENGNLTDELGLTASPTIYMVDRDGIIAREGTLSDADIWDFVARLPSPVPTRSADDDRTSEDHVVTSRF